MTDPLHKVPDAVEPVASASTMAAGAAKSGAAKSGIAWLGVILGKSNYDWADIAAFAAAVYTLLLIAGWLWDRIVTPFLPRKQRRPNGRPPTR